MGTMKCSNGHRMGDPWCDCGWVNWEACEIVAWHWREHPEALESARANRGSLTPVERRVLEQDFAANDDGFGPETDVPL